MEAKVKEEVLDKDYQHSTAERRKSFSDNAADCATLDLSSTTAGKERRSPEQEDSRTSPTPAPPSPTHNGTAASSTESASPPPEGGRAAALQRLRRFLSALAQFATDVGADQGERARQLIFNLVAGTLTIEEFQTGVQECTNYPLRASVPGFLRALLPLAQKDIQARARRAKQTPQQFIRSHEHLVLETGGDGTDIFQQQPDAAVKRRASDPFYDSPQTNGSHEDYVPHAKRPPPASLFLNPLLYPAGTAGLFDYSHYHPLHSQGEPAFERRDGGISVRDVSSMNAGFAESRLSGGLMKTDDEWRNINTMLNCILSMVEKTKRALAILQQRGSPNCSTAEPPESTDIKRAASEIMASAVRQTEERVAEVRRRAEDAVNQVKRQALLELQRAVGAAETKALEIAAERGKRHTPPPPRDLSPGGSSQQNCCWNCGRKAQETCSGCNAARYCGAFCQHKDWENHHQVCSGRDLKPTALLRTSPPSTLKPARAATPITTTAQPTTPSDRLLTLQTAINQERIAERLLTPTERLTERLIPERLMNQTMNQTSLSSERILNPERTLSSERMTLANLSTAQGLIGIGKK